jgi:hypothetical protein
MARAAPEIDLCRDGKHFPVPISSLIQRCSLFRDKPQLLGCGAYEVRSKVDTAAFVEFVKAVRAEPYSLTRSTSSGLSNLSDEFGFVELSASCLALGDECRDDNGRRNPAAYSELRSRMAVVEARLQSLERGLEAEMFEVGRLREAAQDDEVRRLRFENRELAADVSRLSVSQTRLEGAIGLLRTLVENEVDYGRGCEYFYGTNGYGSGGEDISKLLGLRELRQAADSGHSDVQYVCGGILRLGPGSGFENATRSTNYMRESVLQGNSYGEMGLARALVDGSGIARDDPQGFVFCERSAGQGNARGQNGSG